MVEADQNFEIVRSAWFKMGRIDYEITENHRTLIDLRKSHSTALKELVSTNKLREEVAQEIQNAFEQIFFHIGGKKVTCYMVIGYEYEPREELQNQLELLTEMSQSGDIASETMAKVKFAAERDIAWLSIFRAGQDPGNLESITATPDVKEAVQIIMDLLLGESENNT